jgi:glycosyltransferase involved in cell wall biosynthesis
MPIVALDFSTLDHLTLQNGQYRYVIDLLHGLSRVDSKFRFLLLGSQPTAPAEVRGLFDSRSGQFSYHVFRHQPTRWGYWSDHVRYLWLLRKLNADVLHALHGFIPALCPCRVVRTVYDLMYELFDEYAPAIASRPYRILRWLTKHRADRLIAISQTTANDMLRLWGISASKIDVVPLCLSEAFTVPQGSGRSKPIPELLSPYNLEPRKNLNSLLLAFSELLRSKPAELVLYGRAACTPEREREFERLCDELCISRSIRRTGFVSDRELSDLYRSCDVFVFPSVYEGFGLPVLEAMACGACVAVMNASAMKEVVGDAGALLDMTNPPQLASALASLLDKPDLRSELGARATGRSREFTVERLALGTIATYTKAMSKGVSCERA